MKHIFLFLSIFIASQIYGQETWNACNSTVTIIPAPSYDSTFVLSAPSRAALAKGMANWTPSTSSGASYLVYTALLTQSGTSAPVATVLENTLGSVGYAYDDVGDYTITSSGLFAANKTAVFFGETQSAGYVISYIWSSSSTLTINTRYLNVMDATIDVQNFILNSIPIEIRVYP